MDDDQLARELGCDPSDLPRLGLCRRPDPTPGKFGPDVERVAAHFGLSSVALARVIREVDVTQRFRSGAPLHGAGSLLAARDRESEEESTSAQDASKLPQPTSELMGTEGANSAAPDRGGGGDLGASAQGGPGSSAASETKD